MCASARTYTHTRGVKCAIYSMMQSFIQKAFIVHLQCAITMEANLENIRRIYANLCMHTIFASWYIALLFWEPYWKYPNKCSEYLKAQNHEGSTIDSFHSTLLIFKEFVTKGINIIYWFPASAQGPRSLWQPHSEAHFLLAAECMSPYSAPNTLGLHHAPVICLHCDTCACIPHCFLTLFPCWLVRVRACWISTTTCRY